MPNPSRPGISSAARLPVDGTMWPLAATMIGICLVCHGVAGCSTESTPRPSANRQDSREDDQDNVQPVPVAPLPSRPDSPYLNTAQGIAYVGSNACRECHDDVHGLFFRTRHSQALSAADSQDSPNATVQHTDSGYEYTTTTTADGKLQQTESVLLGTQKLTPREFRIDLVVGSGRFGKSYLTQQDGFLVQSPLTWFSDRKKWGMSPGYDNPNQLSFRRAVSARCLYCHAGHVDVVDRNEYHTSIREHFVSCERCHGPGQLHVDRHQSDTASSSVDNTHSFDASIVNPADLNRELQEAICQQCHLQADAQIAVRGFDFDDYRPGLPIQAFRQDYRYGQSDDEMTVVGHVEQMHRSRCFTESTNLTCITCHHPHSDDAQAETLAHFRATCLKCHSDESCTESVERRHSEADNHCTICHMPSAPTEVPHVAFTHHRIGIHRQDQSESQSAQAVDHSLIALLDETGLSEADRMRCRGLGMLRVFLGDPKATNMETLRSAQESLQQAWNLGAADADVASGLATVALEVGWSAKIEEWARTALTLDPTPSEARSSALALLAELQFQQGDYEAALQGFKELTTIRRDARAWFFRGIAAQNLDDTAEAILSLQKSIEINPRNHAAHVALSALFKLKGDNSKQDYHKTIADDLLRSSP